MKLLVGTSGFAFKEWKGVFYPKGTKDDAMLSFYSSRYPTVEINNTFYRLPREHLLADWASQVPDGFTFAIKASRSITHFARLKPESARALGFLLASTATLGGRLGPILFQTPPDLEKDLGRLRAFLDLLPRERRFTMEFRHDSWFDDEVFAELRARDLALCIGEQDDFRSPAIATASWGYLRLHRFDYAEPALAAWRAFVAAQPWSEAYVYFKHDHADGSGPPAVEAFTRAGVQ
ncbi:MAG TPA: DUF72 domain-containing protein [Gemmatimonadaceae bacterium]|nr:DUF72 domain-containing protein [Gemmatimonadaceae bacterium]